VAVLRLDVCAHAAQRRCDAFHRARRERAVADQRELAVLEREEAGDEARERACVAAVELRAAKASEADTVDGDRLCVVYLRAERAHGRQRRLGVVRTAEAADPRLAVGDRADE
jgi:hypothetical protein